MSDPIMCPVCMHEETILARYHDREACYDVTDEASIMRWRPRTGIGGAVVSRWDAGTWTCEVCGLTLTPHDASVLLDAALMHRAPDCDSIVDGMHEDARRAARPRR